MKLAASKVDFRIGCEVGVKVVLVVPVELEEITVSLMIPYHDFKTRQSFYFALLHSIKYFLLTQVFTTKMYP